MLLRSVLLNTDLLQERVQSVSILAFTFRSEKIILRSLQKEAYCSRQKYGIVSEMSIAFLQVP